ncbi:MAG: penicillin-binding protein [Chthoniobacter sp.]|jgi:penicillin-binding protein 1A|nr:penicillin-binding protein [Chthoniobacter sp.]
MWDYSPPRKPFYRRVWFLVPVSMLLVLIGISAIWLTIEKRKWERRAAVLDYDKLQEMESASVIYDRRGAVLGRIFIQNRDKVGIENIARDLQLAIVAAEDNRFYNHSGVDYYGIVRAMVKNYQAGKTRQGASTLTQQLARNTFPDELPSNDRTYRRKLLEMFVAREIEKHYDKGRIVELYLNRVYFGSGLYGAEAAARAYFGKRAKDLTLSEAATLAGLLKSPNNLSPWKNRQACIDQRNFVLGRMAELGQISKEQYEQTVASDLIVKNRARVHQESYAIDLVAQQVIAQFGRDSAISDGYRIYTTIDGELQRKAEKALAEQLDLVERHQGFEHQTYAQYDQLFRAHGRKQGTAEADSLAPPEYLQGSVVVIDNATGGIITLVGGRDFQHSEFNRAVLARRPAGTAFKPLVYAAAFEKGLFPGSVVQDTVIDNRQVMIGGTTGILGEWGPETVENKYEGPISARTALVKSKNAATVRLGMATGLDRVTHLAKKAGINSPLRAFPATYLGSSEVTLMELTLANTIFPSGGSRPERTFVIDRIESKEGKTVYRARPSRTPVLKDTTAYEVHNCLAEVLERGTADRTFTELGLKRFPLGGKTGTAYNFTDAWFVGYSSAVTCGVWAGFDKPQTIYRGAFSNQIALPVWANVIKSTFADYKPGEIAQPKGIIKCEICSASGKLATDKCFETVENKDTGEKVQRRTTYFEIATEAQAPKDGCDVHGAGVRSFVKEVSSGEFPRAVLAVDVKNMLPVAMKAPTVVGEDPYNSIQSINNAIAMKALSGAVAPMDSTATVPNPGSAENVPEVRRAEPVRPMEQHTVVDSTIKLPPPPPVDF